MITGCRSVTASVRMYPRSIQPNKASTTRSSRVASALGTDLMKCAQIMGVTVSDTIVETATAKASVTENSLSSRPTTPSMNSNGMKAATSDTLMERTVKQICGVHSGGAAGGAAPRGTM